MVERGWWREGRERMGGECGRRYSEWYNVCVYGIPIAAVANADYLFTTQMKSTIILIDQWRSLLGGGHGWHGGSTMVLCKAHRTGTKLRAAAWLRLKG